MKQRVNKESVRLVQKKQAGEGKMKKEKASSLSTIAKRSPGFLLTAHSRP